MPAGVVYAQLVGTFIVAEGENRSQTADNIVVSGGAYRFLLVDNFIEFEGENRSQRVDNVYVSEGANRFLPDARIVVPGGALRH